MESTKRPLRIWFLAIYLISQDKTGLSTLAGTQTAFGHQLPHGMA
jgi:hypothetical protein